MADYIKYGTAASLFETAAGQLFAPNLTYHSETEFGIVNADGSTTYFTGTGLVWDEALGKFTGGTITAIKHFSGGTYNDELQGLSLSAASVQSMFEDGGDIDALQAFFLSGDDILDAGNRLDGAIVPVKLLGYDGNDTIHGGLGDDLLGGNSGNDTIHGGGGNDKIYGGSDDDQLFGGAGLDRLIGDSGDDWLNGGSGNDYLHGAAGNDTYVGGAGHNTAVYTRSLHDLIITQTATGFTIIEPHGTDTLTGIDVLATDEGSYVYDSVTGMWTKVNGIPGALLLHPGEDVRGTNGGETINLEGTGKTIVLAYGGNDTIIGSSDFDLLIGGNGNDKIIGEAGSTVGFMDRLYGDAGNDLLFGKAGTDILYGGSGNDILDGGDGSDELTGGSGADIFKFIWNGQASSQQTWGYDIIRDFVVGVDHIQLKFFNLPQGAGTAATLSQGANGAHITLAGAGTIVLLGVDITGHAIGDFLI